MAMSIPSKENKNYYLAGPMSGIPQFNYPAFYRIAKKLRNMGYEIQSPAEMDTSAEQEAAMASPDGNIANFTSKSGSTWGDILAKDVKLVADKVDGIIAMPTWYKSRGARLEVFVANLCRKPVWVFDEVTSNFHQLDYFELWDGISGEKKEEQKPVEAVTKRA
jgi:hypothetical protein